VAVRKSVRRSAIAGRGRWWSSVFGLVPDDLRSVPAGIRRQQGL
jgi:hypothetical protein